ncbi:MAG: hypothetical protein KDF58_09405 [Alphaproteobacteria bacterium]|nr:hypothetical protein [Alphaproteobacteria bacterium]HPF46255.1 hypothetical protein [Emcibacteraceae bacterium]HRW29004.1 hypothetical protein [Emcibacteraceae bacterium]
MDNQLKSKLTVIGFVAFVVTVYTASYFYTKSNNERLLASPRLVMLIGSEQEENRKFLNLTSSQRRDAVKLLHFQDKILIISQTEFENGMTDIAAQFADEINGQDYVIADCLDYSEKLDQPMIKDEKDALKASWIFSACGLTP